MPFCRTRLSAKRFIAGVGGYAAAPLPTAAPSKGPSGGGAVLELANDALGDIAHGINRADHLLLADNDIVEQAFKLRRDARIDQAGSACLRTPNSDRPVSVGTMCFPGPSESSVSSARR